MLLAIDVGNTHITFGVFRTETLLKTFRLKTDRHCTSDELGLHLSALLKAKSLDPSALAGAVIASVVPSLDGALIKACEDYLGRSPLVVDSAVRLGIRNRYKKPEEVGADRLVNAAAAFALYRKAAIIVDFGTATTFDCLSARGDYLGGAICPGMELAGEWLSEHTAKLPRVVFQEAPRQAMGRTTKESLQSGLFWGYIGLTEGLLRRLKLEMKGSPMVIITGGLSVVVGPHLKGPVQILPDLTLQGLRIIWSLNHRGNS